MMLLIQLLCAGDIQVPMSGTGDLTFTNKNRRFMCAAKVQHSIRYASTG